MENQEKIRVLSPIKEVEDSTWQVPGSETVRTRSQTKIERDLERQVGQLPSKREAQLQALAAAVLQAEEQERRRIAQGLHDHIGQILALVKRDLGVLQEAARTGGVEQSLEEIQNLVNQAIQSLRSLTFELSSPVLYELGLDAAMQSLGEQFSQQHGFVFVFETDRQPKPLAEDIYPILYRIARELLFNVVKHAQARTVSLSVGLVEDCLQLTVADDGVGFDAAGAGEGFDEHGGFGLFSIRQQLDHIRGCLEIDSAPGAGTRMVLNVPLI